MSKAFDNKKMALALLGYVDEGESLQSCYEFLFLDDPWILGWYNAAQELENFDEDDQIFEETEMDGIFGAIQYVKDYEKDTYGLVSTDLSNPEQLATAVASINLDNFIYDLADTLKIDRDDDLTQDEANMVVNYLENTYLK